MIKRRITQLVRQSLQQFPAVLLIGARQVGKSTLAQSLVDHHVMDQYITLDDFTHLEAAKTDPDGFLNSFKGVNLVLDEVQRVPDLIRALKKNIDANRNQMGQFLLTGSANLFSYPEVGESLAGRMDIIHLEGFSLGECLDHFESSTFLDELFRSSTLGSFLQDYETTALKISKDQIQKFIFYGGFPDVILKQDLQFAKRWFAAYQTAYVERDVRNIAKRIDVIAFNKLLHLVGLRTGNLLTIKNLAMDVGIDQRTAAHYLGLLELGFQANRLMPWQANIKKRFVKMPKLYLNDSGFASFLCNVDNVAALSQHHFIGALAETWFWAELRKLLALTSGIQTTFYRTHQGCEIDFILEKGNKLCAVEFKFKESISRKDFSGLMDFQESVSKDSYGIVIYLGEQALLFGENLAAIPIHYLI